ncbi:hypothetical protein ACFPZ4_33265, partial [Micromonospora harpali]
MSLPPATTGPATAGHDTTGHGGGVHDAWLPPEAFAPLGSRRVLVRGDGVLVDTVFDEVERACARRGGRADRTAGDREVDLVLALRDAGPLPAPAAALAGARRGAARGPGAPPGPRRAGPPARPAGRRPPR